MAAVATTPPLATAATVQRTWRYRLYATPAQERELERQLTVYADTASVPVVRRSLPAVADA